MPTCASGCRTASAPSRCRWARSRWRGARRGGPGARHGPAGHVRWASGVVVPPGSDLVSDPVPVVAEPGRPITVSVLLPRAPDVVAEHPVALRTSYLSDSGDASLDTDGSSFTTPLGSCGNRRRGHGRLDHRRVGSGSDTDTRWPDALSERLVQRGDSRLSRVRREVVGVPGATDVVLHIGTNDIASGRTITPSDASTTARGGRGRPARPSTSGSASRAAPTPTGCSTSPRPSPTRATRPACSTATTPATGCTCPGPAIGRARRRRRPHPADRQPVPRRPQLRPRHARRRLSITTGPAGAARCATRAPRRPR